MWTAERIIALRREYEWSQRDLADRIGCTREAVSQWESQTTTPSPMACHALDGLAQSKRAYNETGDGE